MTVPLSRIDLSDIDFLLVDDNRFIRRLLKEILLSFGARKVREACSGKEAFFQIDRCSPDIIFCDWMMSPINGLDILKKVKSGGKARIPFIMITGHSTGDHVAAAMGEGADSYIVKPFKPATLMDHLIKVISATKDQHLLD
jgi:two-component system chemotaxis response regulator CheY